MDAGQFRSRLTFQSSVMTEDDMGGVMQGWEDRFTLWCYVRYLRGTEAVMQARLASKAPIILTVRASVATRQISSEWRAVIGGITFDLKEDPRPSENGAWLEMLAEG